MEIEHTQRKLEQLKKEQEILEKELERYEKLSSSQQLAERVHWMFCRVDHIQECNWNYELPNHNFEDPNPHSEWKKPVHQHYLNIANEMLKTGVNVSVIIKILQQAKKARQE